jgi:hypothetical protein
MRRTALTSVFLGLVFGLSAFGNSIVIFNTGEGTGGTAQSTGQTDLHYNLISAPSGVVLDAITTSANAAWTANTATTDWISPGSSGDTGWPVGTYDYQTTFDLTGLDPSTADLSGKWTSDNNGCIDLNGVSTGICSSFAGFGTASAFSITSGFKPGLNTLDFVVENGGGPTGVFAEISGTASPLSSVPEPSLSLLGAGGCLLGFGVLRRKPSR